MNVAKQNNFHTKRTMDEINKGLSGKGQRLQYLIETIPNWETYITDKQLEVAKLYVTCLNASDVDYKLDLRIGTTQQRLFGSSTSKGALGTLEEKEKLLKESGYFDRQQRLQDKKPRLRKKRLTDNTKMQIKELFVLISEVEDYNKYLTGSQTKRLQSFLELKSITKCARIFEVEEVTFKQSLLGRSGKGGIVGRLREAKLNTHVNSWDEI